MQTFDASSAPKKLSTHRVRGGKGNNASTNLTFIGARYGWRGEADGPWVGQLVSSLRAELRDGENATLHRACGLRVFSAA
jgi:hypothetical protein